MFRPSFPTLMHFILYYCPFSEPCARTRSGSRVVDGLSARLVHSHIQTRQPIAVPGHDRHMSRGWRQGHSRLVKKEREKDGPLAHLSHAPQRTLVDACLSRYDMESHDVAEFWRWRCRKQFVNPRLCPLRRLTHTSRLYLLQLSWYLPV